MCLQHSAVRSYQKWDWAGNDIVQDTALPIDRYIYSQGKSVYKYDVDIREFVSIENNAVIKRLVKKLINDLPAEDKIRFLQNDFGNRDFRVRCCQRYLKHFTYQPTLSSKSFDAWQYPDETITLKTGDCEDFAFLLAAMLEACDISPYCIRVALGCIYDYSAPKVKSWDHSWVMYHDEHGSWQIIEPIQYVKHVKSTGQVKHENVDSLQDIEYIPHYVFNRDHLWRVRSNDLLARRDLIDYITEKKFFKKFHPAFAASVHNDIFDQSLKNVSWFNLEKIKTISLYVDANTLMYDPRDHFDFAYISEGWARVKQRLASGTINDFALAAHAIADFYAHSHYGRFMIQGNHLPVYDPDNPTPSPEKLVYDFDKLGELPGCKSSIPNASKYWTDRKQLISGQWYRWYASIPNVLQNKKDFKMRRCLPDHDAVAVDSPAFDAKKHKLFTADEYSLQFTARKNAAIDHIAIAYKNGKYTW